MTPPINSVSVERLDIEGYRKERGPEWCAIFDTMRDYRLSNMVFEGTEEPFCLVDAISNEGGSIESGEEQLLMLADEISLAIDARRAANTPVGDGWVEGVLFDLVLKHFNGKLSREEHEEIRDTLRRSIAARMPASPSLPSQVVDDKTIERAAKAIAESAGDVAWEKIEPLYQEGYRDEALAALAALLSALTSGASS